MYNSSLQSRCVDTTLFHIITLSCLHFLLLCENPASPIAHLHCLSLPDVLTAIIYWVYNFPQLSTPSMIFCCPCKSLFGMTHSMYKLTNPSVPYHLHPPPPTLRSSSYLRSKTSVLTLICLLEKGLQL